MNKTAVAALAMPEGWDAVELGRAATFRTGPFGSMLHQSDYVCDGIPVINPMQIVEGDLVATQDMTVGIDAVRRLADFLLREGDVIIGRRGEMGRCAFVGPKHDGWVCGTGSMIIRAGSGVEARFLTRVLRSPDVIAEIESTSVGSTMINLNQRTVASLRFRAPVDRREQRLIADALDGADALIDSLEQLLAKKRHIKEGAMQELLTGKRRLLGFSAPWRERRLEEIADVVNGLTFDPAVVHSGGVVVLRACNVQDGQIDLSDCVSVQMRIPDRIMVRANDVLVCVRNGSRALIGKCAKIEPRNEGMAFGAFMAVLRSTDHEFLFQQLQSAFVQRQIGEQLGATINQITNTSLKAFRIPMPCDDVETIAIADVLADMDREIRAISNKLAKLKLIKDAMMHELLTGRIRLVDVDRAEKAELVVAT